MYLQTFATSSSPQGQQKDCLHGAFALIVYIRTLIPRDTLLTWLEHSLVALVCLH